MFIEGKSGTEHLGIVLDKALTFNTQSPKQGTRTSTSTLHGFIEDIEWKSEANYLGLVLDEALTFKAFVTRARSKGID